MIPAIKRALLIARGRSLVLRGRMKLALARRLSDLIDFLQAADDPASSASRTVRRLKWGAMIAFWGFVAWIGWANAAAQRTLSIAIGGFFVGRLIVCFQERTWRK
ncbi:MAG: hypothetical protein ACO1SX_02210 [Actinomycetota bacterium]